jgi:hypothetical protein
MKNSNDTTGNRTCDLPACSAVPQPTVPLHAPHSDSMGYVILTVWATSLTLKEYEQPVSK